MKILQVSLKPPYPKVDGGCMAIASMTESMLMDKHEVKLLCMATHKHPFDASKVPPDILKKTEMEAVKMDTRLKPFKALANLFTSKSYNIERFYSKEFELRLIEILEANEFDVIQLESIFCTPYLDAIRTHSDAWIVVRTHNAEFKVWEQLAADERNPLKKWYMNLLSRRLRKYENHVLKRVHGIVAITEDDKHAFEKMGISCPIKVIPVGFYVTAVKHQPLQTDAINMYHLGAMDWEPNKEGVSWFLDEIWPKINAAFPSVACSLAGRKMPDSLKSRSTHKLKIEGEIPKASDFISDKNVAVIPLRSGSGMRVKIVEAMALGKVVLTTSIGAVGIPAEDGTNILIANTPDEFVEKIGLLNENPKLITTIGSEARKLAEREFDLKKLSSKLTYFYANL